VSAASSGPRPQPPLAAPAPHLAHAPHTLAPPAPRVSLDVAELPDSVFGQRDIMWWGTIGFIAIEGFTLVICAFVYLYLWKNFDEWPPYGTLRPSVGIPTLQVALMLLSLPLVAWTQRATRRFDVPRVRLGFWIATVFNAAFVGLRFAELIVSLNVRWNTNAYGSAAWLVLGTHGTLLLVELVEVAGFALFFQFGAPEEKHFADASDVGTYWYFMVLAWIPLYVLCIWGPRFIT